MKKQKIYLEGDKINIEGKRYLIIKSKIGNTLNDYRINLKLLR